MTKYIFDEQQVSDVNLEAMRRDAQLFEIFQNYKEEELFDQVLHLAIHRGYVLDRVKQVLSSVK